MKRSILTLFFLLCAVALFGQTKQEVIRLKNGSVVKGTVVGEVTDSVAVRTADGSLFIFATDDITERTQELSSSATHSIHRPAAATKPMSMPTEGNQQYVYIQPEKSPALAGILSYLFPGAGQFYYGNKTLGWTDLAEHVTCLVLMEGGQLLYNNYSETNVDVAMTGSRMYLVGLIWGAVNQICSIVDAVKGTKAVNRVNGYAMYPIGNGVSIGARPQLSYERPEYALHVPKSLNTGMSLRIAF